MPKIQPVIQWIFTAAKRLLHKFAVQVS
jgi:hypothetical protein